MNFYLGRLFIDFFVFIFPDYRGSIVNINIKFSPVSIVEIEIKDVIVD